MLGVQKSAWVCACVTVSGTSLYLSLGLRPSSASGELTVKSAPDLGERKEEQMRVRYSRKKTTARTISLSAMLALVFLSRRAHSSLLTMVRLTRNIKKQQTTSTQPHSSKLSTHAMKIFLIFKDHCSVPFRRLDFKRFLSTTPDREQRYSSFISSRTSSAT